jgi:hypothetical protein
MAKVKSFSIGLLAVWFLGGPAWEPTSQALTQASDAIEGFIRSLLGAF